MNAGRSVFSQLIEHLAHKEFHKCVARYGGDRYAKNFSCWNQFLAMAFAQLTYRESLRDIETCLGAVGGKLYHDGFPHQRARPTLADANESRDWRTCADCAQTLIATARQLVARDAMGVDLESELVCAGFDHHRSVPGAVSVGLIPAVQGGGQDAYVVELHGNIPAFIRITDGKVHDVNILDEIMPETGAFYAMDRGYIDFQRLFVFALSSAFFVVRTKTNVLLERRYPHPVSKRTGVRSDQTVILFSFESASVYPDLRRVNYFRRRNQLSTDN